MENKAQREHKKEVKARESWQQETSMRSDVFVCYKIAKCKEGQILLFHNISTYIEVHVWYNMR